MKIPTNTIFHGDCIEIMKGLPEASIDLVVTDPPYIVGYRDRDGRTMCNDRGVRWVRPAFAEVARVLKPGRFCVSFYGWQMVERFMHSWKDAGLEPFAHIVWTKNYASNRGLIRHHHEQAYVLSKGKPKRPAAPLRDVIPWRYSGNTLHPTQKPVSAIRPLIVAFSKPGDIVLDPFLGSGTTAVAAVDHGLCYIGIERIKRYCIVAQDRLNAMHRDRRE